MNPTMVAFQARAHSEGWFHWYAEVVRIITVSDGSTEPEDMVTVSSHWTRWGAVRAATKARSMTALHNLAVGVA